VKDLEGKLEKLHELYKSGKIDMKSYADGVNKVKKEIEELSTTLTTTALPAATYTSNEIANVYAVNVGEMETRTDDFTNAVKESAGETNQAWKESAGETKEAWIEVSTLVSDLSRKWGEALIGTLGIAEMFTYQMKEFDNSYWANAMKNAAQGYDQKKQLLEASLADQEKYYNDLIAKSNDEYEKKKSWIEANVTDEKSKMKLLKQLEIKHQTDLDKYRADQTTKEDTLRNDLVNLEKEYQAEIDQLKKDETIAMDKHREDELKKQGSLWNKLKSGFGEVLQDMVTMYATKFIGSLLTSTIGGFGDIGKTIGSTMGDIGEGIKGVGTGLGKLITSLAKGIADAAKIIASAAPQILIAAGVALAIYAGFKLIGSLFKKTAKPGSELDFLRKITDATISTRDMLRVDYKEEFHIMQNSLIASQGHLFAIQARADRRNELLTGIEGYQKLTAEATEAMADQLKNLKSAQGGGIFKQTELAIMHGTPAAPEIAMPTPMFEKFTAAHGKASDITMQTNMNFNIDVRDQIDPHAAQRITRETIVPQVLDAIDVNDRECRTKLEEILKLRI